MSDTQKFVNLRAVEKMRHEKELLKLSYDELDEQLKRDMENKHIPDSILKRSSLHLKILEIKMMMIENDMEDIKTTYLSEIKPTSIC
jgi:hypothetical protein